MASRDEKDRMIERYARGQQRAVSREEQQRRQRAARARRAAQQDKGRRQQDWDEDDDEDAGFEAMRRQVPDARATASSPPPADLAHATVAAVHRGQVELDDGRTARLAGRLHLEGVQLATGDEVAIAERDGVPRVEALLPRRSRLARTDPGDPHRDLVLAANVDVGVIVTAAQDPPLRPGLIDRLRIALERGGVDAVLCVNKVDLLDDEAARADLEAALAPFVALGMAVFRCAAHQGLGIDALRARLAGTTCVFVGHSGVGKSSLLNALDPAGSRATGAVRDRDGRGRHTTTSSSLRRLADGTRVIDTPGVRAFGLEELAADEVLAAFPDLAAFAPACRYADCSHLREPGCAVRTAVAEGRLDEGRYAAFVRITTS